MCSVPARGTPAIAEAIGLGAAVDYLERIGMGNVRAHERVLFDAAWRALGEIGGVRRFGPDSADEHAGVISFVVDGIHPHDLAEILDRHAIAIRAGHHCAQPVMQRYDVPATARISFSVYNDLDDVERLTDGIREAQQVRVRFLYLTENPYPQAGAGKWVAIDHIEWQTQFQTDLAHFVLE